MMMLQLKKWIKVFCTVITAVFFVGIVQAEDIKYPVAAYGVEELAKVREWEKTWAGKKIDKSNIDQVAQFLPESIVKMCKAGEPWGAPAEGFYFNIVPYKQIIETSGTIEATKKYAPTVKQDAEGYITNYAEIAGVPFPNPKNGLEVAWNFDFTNSNDPVTNKHTALSFYLQLV